MQFVQAPLAKGFGKCVLVGPVLPSSFSLPGAFRGYSSCTRWQSAGSQAGLHPERKVISLEGESEKLKQGHICTSSIVYHSLEGHKEIAVTWVVCSSYKGLPPVSG